MLSGYRRRLGIYIRTSRLPLISATQSRRAYLDFFRCSTSATFGVAARHYRIRTCWPSHTSATTPRRSYQKSIRRSRRRPSHTRTRRRGSCSSRRYAWWRISTAYSRAWAGAFSAHRSLFDHLMTGYWTRRRALRRTSIAQLYRQLHRTSDSRQAPGTDGEPFRSPPDVRVPPRERLPPVA